MMAPSAVSTSDMANEISAGNTALNKDMEGMQHNGHPSSRTTPLSLSPASEPLDLLCVGFGPASLAIAIALHDSQQHASPSTPAPQALFLEKQPRFAWHAGMQLPGAKMQISFLKDLATPRDPRSKFTFMNYLFCKGRLNQFINLGTFLPARIEYEDYLRWCAGHFEREHKVAYGMEVESVSIGSKDSAGKVTSWKVTARSSSGEVITRRARHVVIAVGGKPVVPQIMHGLKHVSHSSQYATTIRRIQEKEAGMILRFAVIGGGQSAAEIFNDLWERFPDAQIRLVIKGASLRPSDDSPFVNEIFDPDRVDGIYEQSPSLRSAALTLDRGTNYGVVRLTLLENLYEKLYMQRLTSANSAPSAQILPNRVILSATQSPSSGVRLELREGNCSGEKQKNEILEVDYVFTATGYVRNAHEGMLEGVKDLLPGSQGKFEVGRNYGVTFESEKVSGDAGVWLQGCNEETHGLSDTLLSILAIRGGQLVESIFGMK